jgi:anti-sigma B factor antagonist
LDVELLHEVAEGESVLHVSGEVDMATAPAFRDAALLAIVEHGPSLTLDLSRVTFMDSTGLHVLVATYRRVGVHGGTLRLRNIPDIVRKLLRVTGLDEILAADAETGPAAAGTRVVDAATP